MQSGTRVTNFAIVGVLLSVFVPPGAQAQCEQAKLTASDAVREGYFGWSVAISGDVAVIGAEGNGDAGYLSGAAYVFRRVVSAWVQEQKLIASDAFEGDRFGRAVAISGGTVMVTAFQADNVQGNAGAVYVFRWDGTRWVERQKLVAPDAFLAHQLGWSVSLDGDVAAVGQIGDSFAGTPESGAVYVYRWNGTSWLQEQKLAPPDLGPYDHFGFSVSVKGTVIVGGAPQQAPFGAVYVFRWNGASWVQEQKLTASDGASPDSFGHSVATYQNVLVAGVPNHNGAIVGSGLAYVYRFNGSTWGNEQKLNPPREVQYGQFGSSIVVNGANLLIGAIGLGTAKAGTGSAYLYRLAGDRWIQAGALTASDASTSDAFGAAISLAAGYAVVGAWGNDDACPQDPSCRSGSAYIYDIPLCVTGISAVSTWGLVALGMSVLTVGVLLLRRRGAFAEEGLGRMDAVPKPVKEIDHEKNTCPNRYGNPVDYFRGRGGGGPMRKRSKRARCRSNRRPWSDRSLRASFRSSFATT